MNIKRYKKGFTLIELMVVMAIISLLSSIVLASVKEVRDRAKANAFRANVNQFIYALELYKNDQGVYPGQKIPDTLFGFMTQVSSGSVMSFTMYPPQPPFSDYSAYETALNPYIKKLPIPPRVGAFIYAHNVNTSQHKSCFGDTSTSPYVIHVSSSIPGFDDWPYAIKINGSLETAYRCFSLK